MDNQTGGDRDREQGNRDDQSQGDIGQKPNNPTGTSGRDADLQREGNLGNERTRGDQSDRDDESRTGNRPNQNR